MATLGADSTFEVSTAGTKGGDPLNNPDQPERMDRRASFSASYAALTLAHLMLGVLFLAFPCLAARVFFETNHYEDFSGIKLLLCLFSTLFFTAATLAWTLKIASDNGTILSSEALRLKSGLVTLAPPIILLNLLYFEKVSIWGLMLGGGAMLTTLLVPVVTVGIADVRQLGWSNIVQGITAGVVKDPESRTPLRSVASFLFAAATLVFVLSGIASVLAPSDMLYGVFEARTGMHAAFILTHESAHAAFLCRCLGVGLLTVAPAITFVLKDAADNGYMLKSVFATLNVGLIVTSMVHLSIFGYILAVQGVRWLLLTYTLTWAAAFVAAIVGMLDAVAAEREPVRNAVGIGYEML